MRVNKSVWVLSAFLLSSCNSCNGIDDKLNKVCPVDVRCFVDENGEMTSEEGGLFESSKGLCRYGAINCSNEGEQYCEGYIGPEKEVCDFQDNNCDGKVDEGFDQDGDEFKVCENDCDDHNGAIFPGSVEKCNGFDDDCDGIKDHFQKDCESFSLSVSLNEASQCKVGKQWCENNTWLSCEGRVEPDQREICDNIDNDCDGQVDEDEPGLCGPQREIGLCRRGTQVCSGNETYCANATYSMAEVCNNKDDDCNGRIDNDIQNRICRTLCGIGEEVCQRGQWIHCSAPTPREETCDGVDNDCDSEVDEGCGCLLNQVTKCKENIIDFESHQPVNCGFGFAICNENGMWGSCYFYGIEPETCNNIDDDCNEGIDEQLTQLCGDSETAGKGECQLGTSVCAAGIWSECDGEVFPQEEVCNGLDDDCDDEIDEDLNPHDVVDMMICLDGSGSMCDKVTALLSALSTYAEDFRNTEHRLGLCAFPGFFYDVEVLISPTDFETFLMALAMYRCNYGGIEPGWAVMGLLTDPMDPLSIGWRARTETSSGAYPYVVLVSDETPDQMSFSVPVTESDVADSTSNCRVGNCLAGDKFEVFVMTPVDFFSLWDKPTFDESERLIDMFPVDSAYYVEEFRNKIFKNTCIGGI